MHTCMQAGMHTCSTQAYMHACMHADRRTERQTYIHKYMHTCTHAGGHAYVQHARIHACMHADRRTERQTYIHKILHACIHTYSTFRIHGSDLLSQRWLRHLFNSEKILSQIYPKQQMCPKMAQPYMCKMGQIAPPTTFLI